jgi:hypothetical protein
MSEKYPTVTQVFEKMVPPEGWQVSYEYPNQIGITHDSFNDDQFIMLGDINDHFSFNDCLNVNGSMEFITDPLMIAESLWAQLADVYPELIKKGV